MKCLPLGGVMLAIVSASSTLADVHFVDSTFEPGSWVPHPDYILAVFEQTMVEGNPPPAAHLLSGAITQNQGLQFLNLAQFDPATGGAVSAVSVGLDVALAQTQTAFLYLALEQDGVVFRPTGVAAIGNSFSWESWSTTYASADFVTLEGSPGTPDWSTNGAPFRLGLYYLPFSPGDPSASADFYIDNVEFTVHVVPEPGTCALLAAVALATRRGRSRHR